MKTFLFLLVLLVLSRIETNEATRNLDETHLLLPSLQTRPPVKTPSPNPGSEISVNMASTITERNFVGHKEVVFAPPPPTNAFPLDKTHFLLPSLQTRPPVKTPSPNPGSETSVNMVSTVTERNFVGRKEVVFTPIPPTNAYPLDKTHLLLPSLQTRPPVKTPSPNPGTETSVNMASTVTQRNFVGHKEVVFAPPPPTNAYPLDKTHLLLPSLQTRPPVKTPSPNPGSKTSVNMASTVTERNFVGQRKEVVFAPHPPTNANPLDKTHILLPFLQTRAPVKTPSLNPGSETGVIMASTVTEKNFISRKEVVFAPPPPTNAYPLDKTHLLLPSLQTRPPVKTPSPNPGSGTSVNMASTVTERNFVSRKEVGFAPPPPLPSTNAYPQNNVLFDVSIATTQK
ncbi:extensin-like [Solanum stenotomum]|uniref:extensin-like n=1 Tax=Solanum stenotomum TaxID=172797 RepID=UPI0020D1D056|nr:extensin-like [Solanum stenotomum]